MSHPTRIERANVALEVMLAKVESQRDELLAVCQSWVDYFDKLERDSDPDDPLVEARRLYHAKRIDATRAAIAAALPQ